VNGLPRPSNQNRMIPIALSPKLLGVKYAAYCTMVSPLPLASSQHTIFAPTPIGTPVHTLALRRAAFWVLSFLMPSADVSHARPLRAVPPDGVEKVKITPNFSFAWCDNCVSSVCLCAKKRSVGKAGRWRKKVGSGELWGFVARASAGGTSVRGDAPALWIARVDVCTILYEVANKQPTVSHQGPVRVSLTTCPHYALCHEPSTRGAHLNDCCAAPAMEPRRSAFLLLERDIRRQQR
jgi:hypothetical protein